MGKTSTPLTLHLSTYRTVPLSPESPDPFSATPLTFFFLHVPEQKS